MQRVVLAKRCLRHAAPQIGQHHNPHHAQIFRRACAGIIGVLRPVGRQPQGRALQILDAALHANDEELHRVVFFVFGDPAGEQAEQRHRRGAALAAQLAAHQVHRLHAVGAFIDHVDAGIAHELLHAIVADIAVAAIALHAEVGRFETHVGAESFDHGRH